MFTDHKIYPTHYNTQTAHQVVTYSPKLSIVILVYLPSLSEVSQHGGVEQREGVQGQRRVICWVDAGNFLARALVVLCVILREVGSQE